MGSSNPEDWPLSRPSVAGPNAASQAPLDDTNAEVGITTVSRPVPCGADVFPLFLNTGEPNHKGSRRFPLTSQRLPARRSCAVLPGANEVSAGGNLFVI